MTQYKSKSLVELGISEASSSDSSVTEKVFILCHKPLDQFSVEDLRLMIGQEIALDYLIPLAIEKLEINPFVDGDYYYGDLLEMALSVSNKFWKENRNLYFQLGGIVAGLPQIMEDLRSRIEDFDKLENKLY